MRFASARVRVVEVERLVHIYHGDTVIRVLTINPDRYYQPKTRKGAPHPTKKCHVSSPNKVSHIIPEQTRVGIRKGVVRLEFCSYRGDRLRIVPETSVTTFRRDV